MIYFFADNHVGSHAGKVIFEHLPEELRKRICFVEDDWSLLESGKWVDDCELLILNMIGGTCDIPHPGDGCQRAVRAYCERGGNAVLLHGSSAAFWQWAWWRRNVGFRWVRPNDPDNIPRSVHPTKPYAMRLTKCRHPLMAQLLPFELPADEIYTELEQVCPTTVMMDTAISEGVYPQCFENRTEWNGKFIGFLPGHRPEATSDPTLIHNVVAIINYLLK